MKTKKLTTKIINKVLNVFGKDVLIIYLKDVQGPFFALSKWTNDDFKRSVELDIGGHKVLFRFSLGSLADIRQQQEIDFPLYCEMFITIHNPTQSILDGLNNKSEVLEEEIAKKIYSIYEETINIVTSHGRWYLKLPSIMDPHPSRFDELFYREGFLSLGGVFWKVGGEDKFKPFHVSKIPERTINPIFAESNLLTVKKWEEFGKYLSKGQKISPNISELVRIKSKVVWGTKRIPTIETAALMEVVIRNKVSIALEAQGVSKTKMKSVNDEAGFSILLNMLVPLILKKDDVVRYKNALDNLDALRKVRNSIMHENVPESSIDLEVVKKGVDAAIEITSLLENK